MFHSPADLLLSSLDRFLEADARRVKRRRLARIEAELEADIGKAFREQGKRFVEKFSRLRGRFQESIAPVDWQPLLDAAMDETLDLFAGPIDAAAAAGMAEGASFAAGELGVDISFSLDNPRAVSYLNEYGAKQVKLVNETTRDYIQSVVKQGVDEGWSYNRMAKAITDRYQEFAVGKPQEHIASRAHLVAVTEAGEAYEAGNILVAEDLAESGLTMEKAWGNSQDNRVSQGCLDNTAAGWIPLDEPFPSGHQRPLRFPGCRCYATYRRKRG